MTQPVRWGVLGASKFAHEYMARAIHAAEGAVLSAVATRNLEKAAPFQAFCPDIEVFTEYDAMLVSDTIDAVYIPLPHTLHVEWAIKALEAGKHVLVEKPVAMSAPEIAPLIAKRDETGLQATEAYMIVHHPQWHRVKHLIEDGAIGPLRHVEGIFTYNNADDTANIRNHKASGGGALPDIGVYTYGATRWVTGQEPQEIISAQIEFENEVDVRASVAAQFDGFTAHWVNAMRMHPMQEMKFVGEDGAIIVETPFNAGNFREARVVLDQKGLAARVERFPHVNHYVLQVENFGAAISGKAPLKWTLEDALGTQTMIDRVYAKARS